jgi:hypothetical protein
MRREIAMRGWALVLALAACGGGNATGGGRANDTEARALAEIHVVVVPTPPELPFNPRSARLAQATRELTELAGHPIEIELDAALAREWRSSFENDLISAIENIGRDLLALKEESPRVFERATEKLTRVACRYRAAAERADARFDASTGVLTISEPARAGLVPRGLVRGAVVEELEERLDAVYRSKTPDDVPASERAAYFEYVTRTRPGYGNLAEGRARKEHPPRDETDALANDPHADTVLKVVRLAELVRPEDALGRQIRAWLVAEARYRAAGYERTSEMAARLPPNAPWRRADAAYGRWLDGNAASLSDTQKLAIFRATEKIGGFPGFDRFAFRLAIVDQWRADGHPNDGQGAHFELTDQVACPHQTRASDGRRERNRGCNGVFYAQAAPAALADALIRRGDPILVDNAFANLATSDSAQIVALWQGLRKNPPLWNAATRVVVEHVLSERKHESALVDEANRIWRDAPEQRGAALYVIAWTKRGLDSHYADPFFADFPKRYGEPVSASVFAAFLDNGARAVMLAPLVWPALGRGFSRADPLVPRLERFFADPAVTANAREPQSTLRGIVDRLCAENGTQDLKRVHAWLEQRVRAHPEDAKALAMRSEGARECPVNAR